MSAVKNPFDVSLPSLYPSEKRKDSIRVFSPTQQKAILVQQNGKCAICHGKLDPGVIEYDHEKPWGIWWKNNNRKWKSIMCELP